MKVWFRWMALLLVSLMTGSCSTSLKFPLPASDPELELHTPFLGTWSLEQAGGQVPPNPIEFRVALDGAENLLVDYSQGSESRSEKFHLAQVGALIFAFIEDQQSPGIWNVGQLELSDSGQKLTVGALAVAPLKQHIADGVVAGRIDYWDADRDLLKIEAAATELAAYFAEHPTVFVDAAVLTKVE